MIMKELKELLEAHRFQDVKKELEKCNPVDIAEMLKELNLEEQLIVFRMLNKDAAAEIFAEMSSNRQKDLIAGFTDQELQTILNEMGVDDMADMLEEMPAGVVQRVLARTDPDMRKEVNQLLQYPEDSAGAIMTTEYISLKEDMTVSEAFAHIRKVGEDAEDLYTCWVVGKDRILLGVISIREMLLAEQDAKMKDIMDENVMSVVTTEDQETAARMFDKYNFTALPVVDNEKRLVGMITVDDAIDTLVEETNEDFEKMAAMNPKEEDYFDTSVLQHVRNRLPWLLVLMFSSIATGLIITKYEAAFQAMPLLVALMPMLSDTGGNAGSQTSTLIIRGMALGEIKLSDFFKVVFKESRIALLCGLALGVVNGIRIIIQYHDPTLALIIVITMEFTVLAAKLCGAILPMLAKKLHMDPAIMASPLLTTVVDVCSVFIYFKIASMFLGLHI